jgi:hypothetical protein
LLALQPEYRPAHPAMFEAVFARAIAVREELDR